MNEHEDAPRAPGRGTTKLREGMRPMRRNSLSLLLGAGALLTALASGDRQPAWSAETPSAAPVRTSPQSAARTAPPVGFGVPAYTPAASKTEAEVIEATRWLGIPVGR